MNYYPISIKDTKERVAKKKIFKQPVQYLPFGDLSNVKEITNEFGETLIRVDGDIPADLPVSDGQRFLFISYDQSKYSHGIHKYPAKFFPELPRWLINRYSKPNDLILDPFAGSATTNIEALLLNRNSVAIDVDPFAKYLAKVKTTPIDKFELNKTVDRILKQLVTFNPKLVESKDIPEFPYRENWFAKEILLELAFIKKIILNSTNDNNIKDLCLISMSSVIRAVSNADDNCTRTVVRKKLNNVSNCCAEHTDWTKTPHGSSFLFDEDIKFLSENVDKFTDQEIVNLLMKTDRHKETLFVPLLYALRHYRRKYLKRRYTGKYSYKSVKANYKKQHEKCEICGWNEESLDLHHILQLKDFEKECKHEYYECENMICLCPNCHRVCENKRKRYMVTYLKYINKYKILESPSFLKNLSYTPKRHHENK